MMNDKKIIPEPQESPVKKEYEPKDAPIRQSPFREPNTFDDFDEPAGPPPIPPEEE